MVGRVKEWGLLTKDARDQDWHVVRWYNAETEARERYEYAIGPWRTMMKALADKEETDGFPNGNEATYRWNNEQNGVKYRSFALAVRTVTLGELIATAGPVEPPTEAPTVIVRQGADWPVRTGL